MVTQDRNNRGIRLAAEMLDECPECLVCHSEGVDILVHLASSVPHRGVEHIQVRGAIRLGVVGSMGRGWEGKDEKRFCRLTGLYDGLNNGSVRRPPSSSGPLHARCS